MFLVCLSTVAVVVDVVVVMILMIYELPRINYHHRSTLGLRKKNSIYCLSCVGVVSGEWRATLTRVCGGGGGLRVNTDWLLYIRTLCTLPQSEFDRHSVQIPQCRESLKVALVGGKKTILSRKESLLTSCLLDNYCRGKVTVPVNF